MAKIEKKEQVKPEAKKPQGNAGSQGSCGCGCVPDKQAK